MKPITRIDRKLSVQMSWWGMEQVPDFAADTTAEKIRRIADAGFDGINGFIPDQEQEAEWKELLAQHQLELSVNAYPASAADMESFLEKAVRFGGISFINAQVMTPFVTGIEAESLLGAIKELSRQAGIPVYVETHRGTITQDLIRTARYVRDLGQLDLTIDFSHYVLAGEMRSVRPEAEELLQQLLVHTSSIHARISNGEQIQIGMEHEEAKVMLPLFERWWRKGMEQWLLRSQPGDNFPFVCELGPPPYAMTRHTGEGIGEGTGERTTAELSDRWRESLLYAERARRLWDSLD
ncbi:sugar phosphate isomerase/epimerase family protein [Paenibacillus sp. Leaf72]|uniref:sugar phosphate isomerase/epimerase family protein n=1 Tax=Paenibacillus sp. Leaf72 TaxID=1736234 RepID=UPI001F3B93FF|nr:sugar phosphate isomerase/epimerase [Paenibacillus sp. Leaf72]